VRTADGSVLVAARSALRCRWRAWLSADGVYLTAVIGGIPCMNEGLTEWRELLGAFPLRLPVPRGHVTAIAACEFDRRDGAIIAATSDGGIHLAPYGIEVIRTGLSRLSQWRRMPGA
jgi:hypothetical protein